MPELEIAEAVLAHVGGALAQSYQRSNLCKRRRPLIEQWSAFLGGKDEPPTW
jgi:hypothetical protein